MQRPHGPGIQGEEHEKKVLAILDAAVVAQLRQVPVVGGVRPAKGVSKSLEAHAALGNGAVKRRHGVQRGQISPGPQRRPQSHGAGEGLAAPGPAPAEQEPMPAQAERLPAGAAQQQRRRPGGQSRDRQEEIQVSEYMIHSRLLCSILIEVLLQ